MLLTTDHSAGKTSYIGMRTVNGVINPTYKETCRMLGLLQDDGEWETVLRDAALLRRCPQLRELFVIILQFCFPTNPLQLLQNHIREWWDDFLQITRDEHLLR